MDFLQSNGLDISRFKEHILSHFNRLYCLSRFDPGSLTHIWKDLSNTRQRDMLKIYTERLVKVNPKFSSHKL